jgi:hypothetical protein
MRNIYIYIHDLIGYSGARTAQVGRIDFEFAKIRNVIVGGERRARLLYRRKAAFASQLINRK